MIFKVVDRKTAKVFTMWLK